MSPDGTGGSQSTTCIGPGMVRGVHQWLHAWLGHVMPIPALEVYSFALLYYQFFDAIN